MALAFGVAGALFKRALTGEPSVVETSLLATAAWLLSSDVTYSQYPGYTVHGRSQTDPLKYAYTTRDGRIIQLMLLDPRPYWAPLCRMLDLGQALDDPRFASTEERMRHADALIAMLQERIGAHDWSDYWQPRFEAWDAPWELIRSVQELLTDPQVLANEMTFDLQALDGSVRVVAGPTAFDGRTAPAPVCRAPELGQHTDELLRELGYEPASIQALREQRVVQ
jgi:crotonobetainyl-CoA:carnitine CoA-transferase CaiB-like acyl-CoA transferase